MTTVFQRLDPEPEQRISRLYAWVAIHDDGSEGILSAQMRGAHMPLITSKRRNAIELRKVAMGVARASAEAGRPCRIELRIFDYTGRMEG